MTTKYCGERFNLELPSNWDFEERGTNLALYRAFNGKGAVNISSAINSMAKSQGINELFEVFCKGEVKPQVIDSNQSGVNAVFGEQKSSAKYWRYWVLCRKSVVVFASYNCRNDQLDPQEIDEAEELIRSIRMR